MSADLPALASALERHVEQLAHRIGERRIGAGDSLRRARDYIASELEPSARRVSSSVRFEHLGAEASEADNVILDFAGASPDLVIIGAHYDSAPLAPGADDNASGVAVVIELARRASERGAPAKSLRFAFFANEEPPYFQNAGMGSLAHARGCRERGERIDAMLSIESVGYYSLARASQRYPWPIGLFYPDRGDFIAFVGNLASRGLVRRAIGAFRQGAHLPSEGASLPAFVPGVGWSDHWSFWQAGYRAIMVTDTAPFRNPHYHEENDLPATLDVPRMAALTEDLSRVVEMLAR